MHKKEMPHGGTQGKGTGLVKRCFSWGECFTKWAGSQAELLIMAGVIVIAKVFL